MPDENIHSTSAAAPPKAADSMVENFKKYVPAATFALILICLSYFWNSRDSSSQVAFQVKTNQIAIEQQSVTLKTNAEAMNSFLIAITKLSETQNRLAEDVKPIQDQQQRNTEMLMNRK